LPTAEEVRQNPNLVISLDVPATGRSAAPADNTTVDLPQAEPPVDLPVQPDDSIPLDRSDSGPTDLPKPGTGKRFALPEAPEANPDDASDPSRRAQAKLADRLTADVKSVVELLGWAATTYLRKPTPFLLLAAMLVLPASFLQSCLATAMVPRPAGTVLATVDFSARKAELAARVQESQARGKLDTQAAVELAALTASETARGSNLKVEVEEEASWFRWRMILFIQGLLVLGLAFPVACGVLAIALFDRDSGGAIPAFADIWPILATRSELFLVSLVPAGLLVALGNALFVIPGLILSVLFLFVPHVVLFEKQRGRAALLRSIELARNEPFRAVLAFLAFALVGAVIALLTELLLPTSASRAVAFIHFIVCDLLTVAVLPIPALVLARLYLDLRGPKVDAERLSQAARA
jgi:hypothetical protein